MISASDDRAKAILAWLTTELNLKITKFEPASSDASFRRYFRVHYAQRQFIVMDAPPDKEDTGPFIKVAQLFKQAQVNVPQIIQQNTRQGFLLLEDFGPQCLLDSLTEKKDESFTELIYKDALDSLITLQKNVDIKTCGLPGYDAHLLQTELQLFSDWFLMQQCGLVLNEFQQTVIKTSNKFLINSALEQSQVCVHRDYHSRNLMHVNADNPGIIDFQDAVIGPITYDAVSLLRDCYISWPEAQVEQYLNYYFLKLEQNNLIDRNFIQFKRDFDLMGIQRHLKAIGIFSRLKIRDGKKEYLGDIPRTLNYVINISQRYPELQDFHNLLMQTVLPVSQRVL